LEDLFRLLDERGLAVFLLIALLPAIGYFFRWFLTNYTTRVDTKFEDCMREIQEIKLEVIDNNNKLYNITERLISNQREIQENVSSLDSSLDKLLKFINKNGR